MYKSNYRELLDKLNLGQKVALLTYLDAKDKMSATIYKKKLVLASDLNKSDDMTKDLIDKAFNKGIPLLENNILIEPFYPKPRLIIFGGGHIAQPLAQLSHDIGFSVTIVDDRPKFANRQRFKDADEIICEDFEKSFKQLSITENDFIVIVTRGHRHDGVCLRNSLKNEPKYIGMIGSKRRVKAMMEDLLSEGYSKSSLDKVCSPIGLDIGAVTPNEIGISIVSELIKHRRKSPIASKKKLDWPEFDREVIESVCKSNKVPSALVTIISSKGSVPRGPGAKMIVSMDGNIIGSIGGGCAEADIISLSRNVIRHGKYSIEHVDMTGQVAEDNGMVCGGVLDVLIEPII